MAFLKGSYYERVARFSEDAEGRSSFKGVRARPIADPEPILEHVVALRDRADQLAFHYYSEPREWRRIADANPDFLFFEDALYEAEPEKDEDGNALTQDIAVDPTGSEKLGDIVLIPRSRPAGGGEG